jgi:hypothetical protein
MSGYLTRSRTAEQAKTAVTEPQQNFEERASLSEEEDVPAPAPVTEKVALSEQRDSYQPGMPESTHDGADHNAMDYGAASKNALPRTTAYDAGALHPPVSSQANVRMSFLEIILSFWTNLISWFTIGPHLKYYMDNQGPRFSCEFIVGIPILLAIVFFLYKSFSYVSNFVLSLSQQHFWTLSRTYELSLGLRGKSSLTFSLLLIKLPPS